MDEEEATQVLRQAITRNMAKTLGIPVNALVVVGLTVWFVMVDNALLPTMVYAVTTVVFALVGLAAGVYALLRPVRTGWLASLMLLSMLTNISLGVPLFATVFFGTTPSPPIHP